MLNTDGANSDIFGNVLELHSDNGAPMRGSTTYPSVWNL